MKVLYMFFLLLFLFSSTPVEKRYPHIVDFKYDTHERITKSGVKSKFVNFVWEVTIQGKNRSTKMWFEIIIYDKRNKEIERFGKLISVREKKLQKFNGTKMIEIFTKDRMGQVSAHLAILNKKY